jgi:PilZ domain
MLARHREDRRSVRRFTRRGATVSFSADKPSVDCVIWDISDGGARLAVALPLADLPRHFILNLFRDESVQRHCEVVWMDKRFVGVRFTEQVP